MSNAASPAKTGHSSVPALWGCEINGRLTPVACVVMSTRIDVLLLLMSAWSCEYPSDTVPRGLQDDAKVTAVEVGRLGHENKSRISPPPSPPVIAHAVCINKCYTSI